MKDLTVTTSWRIAQAASTTGFLWLAALVGVARTTAGVWLWVGAALLWLIPGGCLCWMAIRSRRDAGGTE